MYESRHLIFRSAIAALTVCVFLAGCGTREVGCIMPGDIRLRPGDLVLRRGIGLTSRVVLAADEGSGYSHVGMVVDSCGVVMVVHAVPDEPDDKGGCDMVKMEPPERFYFSIRAERGLVLRHHDRNVAEAAATVAMRMYRRKVLFDHDYDDRDTTRMYCCELVEFAYTEAGRPLTCGRRHNYTLPGMRFEHLILPSDFILSGHLETVAEF